MSLQLTIPKTSEVVSLGKPHTLYHVLLRLPIRSYNVKKRYSDFLALHDNLSAHTGHPPPFPLPKKLYFSTTVGNPALTEERRVALESYLGAILTSPDSRWRDSPAWCSFLSLPASWSSTSSHPTAVYTSGFSSGPITDPTIWLDSHRELKTMLHDARIFLLHRDQACAISEQHEASASAKRCLVKASALISALDSGLYEVTTGRNSEKHTGDGEIRRRRDLVAAARQERDGLEDLANSLSAKAHALPSASSAPTAERSALFGGNGGRSGARRVLGAPLQETQTTRELENVGVLQLQQQMMQDQDQGLEGLLKIVRRQKEMGIAIGAELETQTQMLGDLGEDVDKMSRKTEVAKKRADRIS